MSNGFRYVVAMSFGFLSFGLLINHAGKTNFGAVNVQVEVPRHDTPEETQAKLDAAGVPPIFSFKTFKFLWNGSTK